jgi:hypothetical protein
VCSVFCIVLCTVSPHIYSCLFSIRVQFYRHYLPVESQIQLENIISYHVVSYHISYHKSCHIIYHIIYHMPYRTLSYRIIYIISVHISYRIVSYRISYHVVSYLFSYIIYRIIYHIMSYHIIYHHHIVYNILYHIVSYHISFHIISNTLPRSARSCTL